MTTREFHIHRAILETLRAVPEGYVLPEATLHADAARMVTPPARPSELAAEVTRAEQARRLVSVPSETGFKFQITDAGRAWLAQNP